MTEQKTSQPTFSESDQLAAYFRGVGGTGKSTLLKQIMNTFPKTDIGQLQDDGRTTFSDMYICAERGIVNMIDIASCSMVKYDAVTRVLPSPQYVRKCHATNSEVGEQPIGMQMIRQGALNRLKCISSLPAVSFETGLVETADGWCDLSYVVLRTNLGDFVAWSLDLLQRCPAEELQMWLALDDEKRNKLTLGTIIATMRPDELGLKEDWYRLVGPNSRVQVLEHIFSKVWRQFIRNCEMMPLLTVTLNLRDSSVGSKKPVSFINIQHNMTEQPLDLVKCVEQLTHRLLYDTVVLVDARGFLFASMFMNKGIRTVMARKVGKLSSKTYEIKYEKEYGTDTVCMEVDAIPPNSNVLIVDDVLATGGTAEAISKLVETKFNSRVVACIFPFAIEIEPGKLMCTRIPREKIRFAQSQLLLPKWETGDTNPTRACRKTMLAQDDCIAIIPPSLHTFEDYPRATVKWGHFNMSSNIQFCGKELEDKNVSVFINMTKPDEMGDVLSLAHVLHRKNPHSITVIVPFMEQGTQDRIEYDDDNNLETLAQVDCAAQKLRHLKTVTFDIHAEQSVFAFRNLKNVSIVSKLFDRYHMLYPNSLVVFPDDGAAKRFGKLLKLKSEEFIVFRKTRGKDDTRTVKTDSKIANGQSFVIIDDLVRTAGTLNSVAQYLISHHNAHSVAALFAHAPFEPKASLNLMIFGDNIWTSNSCPDKVPNEWVKFWF